MDITSPFVVVSAIVLTFFACIFWATRANVDSEQPHESESGHPPVHHGH